MRYLVAVLAALFSQLAVAAGPYDGIYQITNTSWFSVHQTGTHVVVASFSSIPSVGIQITFASGQYFVPSRADGWDLFGGDISGSSVNLTGETAYGACYASISMTFNASSASFTNNSFSNTPAGTNQGFNCPALYQYAVDSGARAGRAIKIF